MTRRYRFFALPVGGFFRRLEFDRRIFDDEEGLRRFRFVGEPQGVLPVAAGYPDKFVQDV
jgi:hypothetical protein